jgi:hypothetical protein
MVTAVGLGVLGFAAGIRYTGTITVPDSLDSATRYDLWRALLAGIVGFALAASVLFVIQLHSISGLGRGRPPAGRIASWVVLVVLAVGSIVGMLIASSTQDAARADPSNVGATLNADIRPITGIVGLCAVPGLVTFVALAWVVSDDRHWTERGRCQVQLLLRARSEVRRSLGAGGTWQSFETVVVIAAPLLTALVGVATGN